MDNDQRIFNLKSFGYNSCEASFLCFAALQSGYFLRRQYAAYTGKVPGYADVTLGERAYEYGHAKVTAMRHNRMLYHLCSKPFYAAIGEEDNRNRRDHEPQAIRRRLMTLDFALANRSLSFFPTEADKVAFFSTELGINDEHLPGKLYRGVERGTSTMRYFVDKLPIFIDPSAEGTLKVVHFGYIDEGLHSTSGFEQHLRDYRSLFARIGRLEMLYIACSPHNFLAAEQLFGRVMGPARRVPIDPLVVRIIEYFKVRDAYERRDMSGLSQPRLIQFRADRAEFSDAKFEHLYAQWKNEGDAPIVATLCPESVGKSAQVAQFRTHLLPFQYDLLGTIVHTKSKGETR